MLTPEQKIENFVKKGGTNVQQFLLEEINTLEKSFFKLENDIDELKKSIDKDIPEDTRVEKISMRLAAKLATLEKGDKGDSPTDDEILKLIKPLIPDPIKGDRGTQGQKGDKPIVGIDFDFPKDGRDGKDGESIIGPKGEDGKDGSPDKPEQIRDKLESLRGDERLDKSAIKGFEDDIQEIRKALQNRPQVRLFGGARKSVYTKAYDLTSLCDGSTKTFTLPMDTLNVTAVFGTQFPLIFAPTTDWTFSGRTLTLTDAVGAPQTGQTLICLIEVMFYY